MTLASTRLRLAAPAVLLGLALSLAGCGSANGSGDPATTSAPGSATSATAGGSSSPTSPAAAAASATSADGAVTLTANAVERLTDGQEIAVTITGLDPSAGYYLALCGQEQRGPVPGCIEGEGRRGSQWLTSRPGGTVTIPASGEVSATIVAVATGTARGGAPVNCREQRCTVKLFGDHTNGFVPVADLPVTFA